MWRRAVDLPNSSPGRVLSATETAELRPWYGAGAARDVSCNQLVTLRYADIEIMYRNINGHMVLAVTVMPRR